MHTLVPLRITAGLPFAKTITANLPVGRNWWLNLTDFEVLCQIREKDESNSPLVLDLLPYLTPSMPDLNTISIALVMTGADTMLLLKKGYYDMIVSDVSNEDARAYVILKGPVKRYTTITNAGVVTP